MSNDPILHLLGLARKAGRLEIGEEPVGAACRARKARLVLLASDAAPNTCRRAAHFGEAGNVMWLQLPFSKGEVGAALGRSSCAMLALTDAGFAASLSKKLAAQAPDRFSPAAQQLEEKAQRMLQRQREKRRHEKNLQEGKRKPWAPPPAHKPEGKKTGGQKPGGKQPGIDRSGPRSGSQKTGGRPPSRSFSGQGQGKGKGGPRAQQKTPAGQRPGGPRPAQRSGGPHRPGPGGRKLSGKVRHNP